MDQKIDILSNNITIDVKNADFKYDNYGTILFQARGISRDIVSNLEISLSDANYKYLGEKLYPHGLMPESFEEKLALLNYLIHDIGPVYDYDDTSFSISGVEYKDGELYFKCEEEQNETIYVDHRT